MTYQQLRRDLGPMAGVILNQAERGTLFEWMEQHTLPTDEKRRRRTEWHDAWQKPFDKPRHESEIWDNDETPLVCLYEIRVKGEYYATTRTLKFQRIVDNYPKFRQLWWQDKVDIIRTIDNKLIQSNYQQLNQEDNDEE